MKIRCKVITVQVLHVQQYSTETVNFNTWQIYEYEMMKTLLRLN